MNKKKLFGSLLAAALILLASVFGLIQNDPANPDPQLSLSVTESTEATVSTEGTDPSESPSEAPAHPT